MYRKNYKGWRKHIDFILLDAILLQLSYLLAFLVRYGDLSYYSAQVDQNNWLILVLSSLFCAFFLEIYKGILKRGHLKELYATLTYTLVAGMFLLVFFFTTHRGYDFSRFVLPVFLGISTILIFCERVVWKHFLWLHMTHAKKKMLLVTTRGMAEEAIRQIRRNSVDQYDIIGLVLTDDPQAVGETIRNVEVVSALEDAAEYMRTRWVDEVMVDLPRLSEPPVKLLDDCAIMGITTHMVLHINEEHRCQQVVEKVGGMSVLTESIRIPSDNQIFMKRLLDILGGMVGVLITGILTIFIAPAIYLSDPGPIFFAQDRVGQNGKIFKLYKFRSMYTDAEERKKELMDRNAMKGFMFKMENDPRIIGSRPDGTRHGVGYFLRRYSLDEWPQFFSVLTGQMSLVGTRPPTVGEWTQYAMHHRARLVMKPGITGLWQTQGRGEITDFEEVIALDMEYINTWTVSEDIKLLFKTFGVVLKGTGA